MYQFWQKYNWNSTAGAVKPQHNIDCFLERYEYSSKIWRKLILLQWKHVKHTYSTILKHLVSHTNNSDFFQGSVRKEQLQNSFPKVCEQVWPAPNKNWFCNNQIFPLNPFPTKIMRHLNSVPGLHRYKKHWKQGCDLVSLSMNVPAAFTTRILGRADFFQCLLKGKRIGFGGVKFAFIWRSF